MDVAVIDYGSGNLHSMGKALARAAGELGAGHRVRVTADPAVVAGADRIVLPGVGAFADCRRGLDGLPGMTAALDDAVRRRGRPFLGTCVGMQLMATRGHEHGVHPGLDWIRGDVVRIAPAAKAGAESRLNKVPHMGWNDLHVLRPDHPVLAGLVSGTDVYFVHSYHLMPADPADRLAEVEYGDSLTAAVARDNLVGTQFHPEKSQAVGLRLLMNFLRWRP